MADVDQRYSVLPTEEEGASRSTAGTRTPSISGRHDVEIKDDDSDKELFKFRPADLLAVLAAGAAVAAFICFLAGGPRCWPAYRWNGGRSYTPDYSHCNFGRRLGTLLSHVATAEVFLTFSFVTWVVLIDAAFRPSEHRKGRNCLLGLRRLAAADIWHALLAVLVAVGGIVFQASTGWVSDTWKAALILTYLIFAAHVVYLIKCFRALEMHVHKVHHNTQTTGLLRLEADGA